LVDEAAAAHAVDTLLPLDRQPLANGAEDALLVGRQGNVEEPACHGLARHLGAAGVVGVWLSRAAAEGDVVAAARRSDRLARGDRTEDVCRATPVALEVVGEPRARLGRAGAPRRRVRRPLRGAEEP